MAVCFFLMIRRPPRSTRTDTSFPTRRSSDLPGGTWAQVNKLVKLTKTSRYAKMLGGEAESRERLVSLAKDMDTLKLFLRGWAIANGQVVNEQDRKSTRLNSSH